MNITAVHCPKCGGAIDFDVTGREFIFCPYCGQQLHLSEGEKKTVHIINEADIIRAQNEGKRLTPAQERVEKTKARENARIEKIRAKEEAKINKAKIEAEKQRIEAERQKQLMPVLIMLIILMIVMFAMLHMMK